MTGSIDFRATERLLDDVQAQIADRDEQRRQQMQQRLESTTIRSDAPAAFKRIQQAIDLGNFPVASEYLHLAQHGQPLPELTHETDPFNEFFPGFVGQAYTYFNRTELRRVVPEVRRGGRHVGPLNLMNVRGKHADAAADLLETWMRAKSRPGELAQAVAALMRGLGFKSVSVVGADGDRSAKEVWLELQTEPIQERSVCPVCALRLGGQRALSLALCLGYATRRCAGQRGVARP